MDEFPDTVQHQIRLALDMASHALAEVEGRATHLREFIRLGEMILGTPAPSASPARMFVPHGFSEHERLREVGPSVPPALPAVRQPMWKEAEAILREVGHPMPIDALYQHLIDKGRARGGHPKESLRTGMRAHSAVFRRVKRGVYGLAIWGKSGAV